MFRCRDLLTLPTMAKARLLAGENGLDNTIRWSYKAENMNFADWVHGQELLIVSTSVINSEGFNLHVLVQEAIRLKISGVLLLTGEEYISSISRSTLNLAQKENFPIFSLPGNIPLVDVFEELGHAIVYQEKAIFSNEDLMSDIVFGKQIDEKTFLRQAELLGYNAEGKQRIFIINIDLPKTLMSKGFIESLSGKLQNAFWSEDSEVMVSCFHFDLVGLTSEPSCEKINDLLTSFVKDIKSKDNEIKCHVGVGSSYENLTLLGKSFTEVSTCIKLADPVCWYEQLGFLKVLLSIEDSDALQNYMDMILGNIIRYDKTNDSDLLNTLITYFDLNESMKDVAERITVHPNTVKYRLQKVEELSGLKMSVSKDKMQLYNAILIRQMLL